MNSELTVLFTGNVTHKLDPKSRVSVPSSWRGDKTIGTLKLIEAQRQNFSIIKCYTELSFHQMVQDVRSKAEEKGHSLLDINNYLGVIIGMCSDAELSSQGKLLIPKKLRDKMQLGEQLLLVGRGDYFELWEPSAYDSVYTPEAIQSLRLNLDFGILS